MPSLVPRPHPKGVGSGNETRARMWECPSRSFLPCSDGTSRAMAVEEERVPESLFQQCQYFILMHLDEFPVSHLSLLPLNARKELLWRLPLADVCQLEGTAFTDGLDMAACWRFPFDEQRFYTDWWGMEAGAKLCYIDEWGAVEYKRSVLYGLLTAYALGFTKVRYSHFYHSLFENSDVPLTLLYAVRKSPALECSQGDHTFPSRYSHFANPECELTADEVVKCFDRRQEGELPKILAGILYRDADFDDVHFLYNVVCLSFVGFPLKEDGFKFVEAVIKGATHLETLFLDQWGEDNECVSFDDFCEFLSSQNKFLSKFRQLSIQSSNSCRFLGFEVSLENFNRLISAYFAAPTDHMQRLEFNSARITYRDTADDCSPMIDQQYLQFKALCLDSTCQFVTIDEDYEIQDVDYIEPTNISDWLGQPISILKVGIGVSYLFKVDKKIESDNVNPRKRTASNAGI